MSDSKVHLEITYKLTVLDEDIDVEMIYIRDPITGEWVGYPYE